MSRFEKPTVVLGEGVAVIRRPGRSAPIVANVLGIDTGPDGAPLRVYLDRLVHDVGEGEFEGWSVSGAISSILEQHGARHQRRCARSNAAA